MDSSADDVFTVLAGSDDPLVWKYAIPEIGATRHPQTGETLLHVAARTNKRFAIDMLMLTNIINPVLRSQTMQRALDLATDHDVVAKLTRYSEFQPTRLYATWYGPYFFKRAFAFLCVVVRWRRSGEIEMDRPTATATAMVVLRQLARIEHV